MGRLEEARRPALIRAASADACGWRGRGGREEVARRRADGDARAQDRRTAVGDDHRHLAGFDRGRRDGRGDAARAHAGAQVALVMVRSPGARRVIPMRRCVRGSSVRGNGGIRCAHRDTVVHRADVDRGRFHQAEREPERQQGREGAEERRASHHPQYTLVRSRPIHAFRVSPRSPSSTTVHSIGSPGSRVPRTEQYLVSARSTARSACTRSIPAPRM